MQLLKQGTGSPSYTNITLALKRKVNLRLGFLYEGVTLTPNLELEFLYEGVILAPDLQFNYSTQIHFVKCKNVSAHRRSISFYATIRFMIHSISKDEEDVNLKGLLDSSPFYFIISFI